MSSLQRETMQGHEGFALIIPMYFVLSRCPRPSSSRRPTVVVHDFDLGVFVFSLKLAIRVSHPFPPLATSDKCDARILRRKSGHLRIHPVEDDHSSICAVRSDHVRIRRFDNDHLRACTRKSAEERAALEDQGSAP